MPLTRHPSVVRLAVATVAVAVAVVAAPIPHARAADGPVARATPGGVSFWHVETPDADYGVIALRWPNTHALDVPGREGLYSLGPALLGARVRGEQSEALEDVGQGVNLTNSLTDTTLVLFAETRPGDDAGFMPVADVAAGVLARVDLEDEDAEEDLARLQREIADSLDASDGNPGFRLQRTLGAFVAGGDRRLTALSNRPVETVAAVTTQDVARWRDAVFDRTPIVVAAGPQPVAAMAEAIDTVLEGLPEAAAPSRPARRAAFANLGETVVLEAPDAPQAIVQAAIAVENAPIAGALLIPVLAGGPGSVLFESLRTELGVAYDVRPDVVPITYEQVLFSVGAAVPPERAPEAAQAMRDALAALAAEGVTPDRFEQARAQSATFRARGAAEAGPALDLVLSRIARGLPGGLAETEAEFAAMGKPEFDAFLAAALATPATLVVLTPQPELFPGACVVSVPEDAAGC